MRALDISAGIVEQRYRLSTIRTLSDKESDALKKKLDAAPADGKVAIFNQLRNGFSGDRVGAMAGNKESITALTMGLSMEAPRAASTILRDQEILKQEPKVGLSGAELTAARDRINSNLGSAYQGNVEHHATITDAALAAYAAKSWQAKDLSGTFNSSRMDEAVQEVTGGLLSIGGGMFSRGYKIQPPRYGMTEGD